MDVNLTADMKRIKLKYSLKYSTSLSNQAHVLLTYLSHELQNICNAQNKKHKSTISNMDQLVIIKSQLQP